MKSDKILEMNVRSNCMRIVEILEMYCIEDLSISSGYDHAKQRAELTQRMALLRKDSIRLSKYLNGSNGNENNK